MSHYEETWWSDNDNAPKKAKAEKRMLIPDGCRFTAQVIRDQKKKKPNKQWYHTYFHRGTSLSPN